MYGHQQSPRARDAVVELLNQSKNKQFLNINISHGSVVTHLRCGGMFHNDLTANLWLSLSVKEFWKSVNIWRSYRQKYSGMFFDSQCSAVFSGETATWLEICIHVYQLPETFRVHTHNTSCMNKQTDCMRFSCSQFACSCSRSYVDMSRYKNLVWNYFVKLESDSSKAVCKICDKVYSLGSTQPKCLQSLKTSLPDCHCLRSIHLS